MIILFIIFFTLITFYRPRLGLFFLFLLLPTYLIRFSIGPIPTNLLEIMVIITILVFSIKYLVLRTKSLIFDPFGQAQDKLRSLIFSHRSLFLASAIFLTAATISVFTSADIRSALGEWKAFYIEPFLLFLVIILSINNEQLTLRHELRPNANNKKVIFNLQSSILISLTLLALVTSLLAIYQHFTGWMVPWAFWENRNTFRVTGWYGFPNGVGLFLAPLVPLALYLIYQNFNALKQKLTITNWLVAICSLLFVICSLFAIFFAKSTGAIVGLATGLGLLLIFNKKTRWPIIIAGVFSLICLICFPQFKNIKQEIFMQDRSGQIRIAIWKETLNFLSDHPIACAGLASYQDKITPYHTTVNGEGIEIFHHPHNIFLTMWVNLGILGLIGFVWILVSIFQIQYSIFKKNDKLPTLNYFLISSLVIIIVTGLVDSPYIKNDLAILFWSLLGMILIDSSISNEKKTKIT